MDRFLAEIHSGTWCISPIRCCFFADTDGCGMGVNAEALATMTLSLCSSMLLFASQTGPTGVSVILPALLITGLLVAASQAFVPKNNGQD